MLRHLQIIEKFYSEQMEIYCNTIFLMEMGTPIMWDYNWKWGVGLSFSKIIIGLSGGVVGIISFIAFQIYASYPALSGTEEGLAREVIVHSWDILSIGLGTAIKGFFELFPEVKVEEPVEV
jgi:hypothetical protein